MIESSRCFGFFVGAARPPKAMVPEKVAIAAFQVRYALKVPELGYPKRIHHGGEAVAIDAAQQSILTLELDDYNRMTNELYDRFVETLDAYGLQVAAAEDVKNTGTYGTLRTDFEAVLHKPGQFARGTAYGLKIVRPRPMQFQVDKMAGITKELGVDAVLTVFLHLGLTSATGAEEGDVSLCVGCSGTVAGAIPMEITFLAGLVEKPKPGGGVVYTPRWKTRFGITKNSKALVYQDSLRDLKVVTSFFGEPEYGKDVETYVAGARSLMGIVGDVALAHWAQAMGR
jgi:hypothetical protein